MKCHRIACDYCGKEEDYDLDDAAMPEGWTDLQAWTVEDDSPRDTHCLQGWDLCSSCMATIRVRLEQRTNDE